MRKRLLTLGLFASLMALLAVRTVSSDDKAGAKVGQKVSAFTLTDPRDQTRVSLADFKESKAVVVVFLGTQCPINNLYLARLAELHREYGPKGVQFVGINANQPDTSPRVAAHAREHRISFPVLKDAGNLVADQFGARRTPEAFVLDRSFTIRYQGRIDDQYGIGYQRPRPARRDLADALDAVLAGRTVAQPATPVAGCVIARAPKPKDKGTVTYTKHVARILQNNCQECHRPGQIGPMPLLTYDDVAPWAETIAEVVRERRMPPWHADPRFGKWSNDRRLAQADHDTLLAWIEQGCPKGDDQDLPPARRFVADWRIGKPDIVLTMPREFDVPAKMPRLGIPYKYFEVDPGFTEDKWFVRGEARPGAADVVHHIVVFIVPPGVRFNPDDPDMQVLCGTAPGDMPLILEPGMAKKVPAGSKLMMQMHYTPTGIARKDRSSIGLVFAKEKPTKEVRTFPIFNAFFRIPPGDANYQVKSLYSFPQDGWIVNFMPHMHLRGKDFLYQAVYPDGKRETLLSVPRFHFGWQSVYRCAEPIFMPKDSQIRCVAHFDNSAKNPNNPDPTRTVYWGDQTWQEMMIGWMDAAFEIR